MGLLETRRVSRHFGGIQAVNDVSFEVEDQTITAIIGPNGAGKTTLFNLITCIYPPSSGEIYLNGHNIVGRQVHDLANHGVARTFQNLELFGNLTVLESVMVGGYTLGKAGVFSSLFGLPRTSREAASIKERAMEALDLVGLVGRADDIATELSYGQQRLVEIARALCLKPKLLLLDEPVAGLNPGESTQLGHLIVELKKRGITIIFVEHDMETVMDVADRIVVLNFGTKLAEGSPEEIQKNPAVIAAYLGEG